MGASSGVVPSSGARFVMLVVATSSSSEIAVQSSTNRSRQSIRIAASLVTNQRRNQGVSKPPRMIQNRTRPSASRLTKPKL